MDYIYTLGSGFSKKSELGSKGANLVLMTQLGFPIPGGFVVGITAYKHWLKSGLLPEDAIAEAMTELEQKMSRRLGAGLEVSVRSSAPVSMPGMMKINILSMQG